MSKIVTVDEDTFRVLLGAARQLHSAYARIDVLSNQHGFANPMQQNTEQLESAIEAGESAAIRAKDMPKLKSFGDT